MIIRLALSAIAILSLFKTGNAGRYGDEDDWGYASSPSSSFLSSSQVLSKYPSSFKFSRYPSSSFSSRPPSFLETQFHSQLTTPRPPSYYHQPDNTLYSSGGNPFSSGGLGQSSYQNSAFNNRVPPSSYDDSNYQSGGLQESSRYSHFSKSPSLSNPVPQDTTDYNQLSSTQDPDQAFASLLQEFNNQEGQTGSLNNNFQPLAENQLSSPQHEQYHSPPQEQFNSQPQEQFYPQPQEQLSSPPPPLQEEFSSPSQEQFPSPPQGEVSSPPEEQFPLPQNQLPPPPPSPSKPPLKSGPGGEKILLGPEQAQILRQVMPELGLKNPDRPVEVTPEQLKKLQDLIARTNFQLPPGFPPEFVAEIQAAAKAPPKRVHKATAVRSKNKKDEDPEEFIRNLASYKRAHGIDTSLGENAAAQEGLVALPAVDTDNL